MLTSIELDCEPKTWAVEIECERADRMLPSEVQAIELIAAKRPPKPGLCLGHISARLPCTRRHYRRARKARPPPARFAIDLPLAGGGLECLRHGLLSMTAMASCSSAP